MPFPKFVQYEDYLESSGKDDSADAKFEAAKSAINDGIAYLKRLIGTDEAARNTRHLGNDLLKKIQMISISNSLSMTKAKMFGDKAIVKIVKANSLPMLPALDVEKKP